MSAIPTRPELPRDEDGIQLVEGIDPWQRKMFVSWGVMFERLGYNVYAGTVPASVVAKRRAKGRVQRRSRKLNRGLKRTGGRR